MSELNALLLTIFCLTVFYAIWYCVFERMPLEQLGLERVRRVLETEAPWRRQRILSRGWITRDEWFTIRVRQLRGDGQAAAADREAR